jgi:phage gp36-like protein
MAYADVSYFRLNAPSAQAFTDTSDAVIQAALDRFSTYADGFLIRKFMLPLVSWGDDLRGAVTDLSAYQIMKVRGYNPDVDPTLRDCRNDADTWLKSIPLGTTPMVIDSSGATKPGVNGLTPTVTSGEQRGFSSRPTQATFPPCQGDFVGD